MKSYNGIILAVAATLGLTAAFVSSRLSVKTDSPLERQAAAFSPYAETEKDEPKIEMVEVAVAKKNLSVGAVIEEDDLTLMAFPKNALPSNVVCEIKELKDKVLYRNIEKGSYISSREVRAVVGLKIPDGMYKYAIRKLFNEPSDLVQLGDKVDIIYTEPSLDGKFKQSAKLRDLLVLGVDIARSRSGEPSPNPKIFSVSLAVTEEQSLLLSSYEKRGEVKMVLRDPAN